MYFYEGSIEVPQRPHAAENAGGEVHLLSCLALLGSAWLGTIDPAVACVFFSSVS